MIKVLIIIMLLTSTAWAAKGDDAMKAVWLIEYNDFGNAYVESDSADSAIAMFRRRYPDQAEYKIAKVSGGMIGEVLAEKMGEGKV